MRLLDSLPDAQATYVLDPAPRAERGPAGQDVAPVAGAEFNAGQGGSFPQSAERPEVEPCGCCHQHQTRVLRALVARLSGELQSLAVDRAVMVGDAAMHDQAPIFHAQARKSGRARFTQGVPCMAISEASVSSTV